MRMTVFLRRSFYVLVTLLVLVAGSLFGISAMIINRHYDSGYVPLVIPRDSAAVQEGQRLVQIAHCSNCHGDDLGGKAFHKIDGVALLVAPDISRILPQYTDDQLERLLRRGIKKDGQAVWIMPAAMYHSICDDSLAKMIAYLRTIPPSKTSPELPPFTFYLKGRLGIVLGKMRPDAEELADQPVLHVSSPDTAQLLWGKYLTATSCTSCHGVDLKGKEIVHSPNLVVAGAYSEEGFIHLLRTGEGGLGRKWLGLMSIVAKDHLSYLTEPEMKAIYAFLKNRSMK